MSKIKIIIVDDLRLIRKAWQLLLNNGENYEVVAEASNGEEAIREVLLHKPDVILMDINMPKMNGITATRKIMELHPKSRIIGLSMLDEEESVQKMIDAGACGFLNKNCSPLELYIAIDEVMEDLVYLGSEIRFKNKIERSRHTKP
jgi:two-component system response regulator DegU